MSETDNGGAPAAACNPDAPGTVVSVQQQVLDRMVVQLMGFQQLCGLLTNQVRDLREQLLHAQQQGVAPPAHPGKVAFAGYLETVPCHLLVTLLLRKAPLGVHLAGAFLAATQLWARRRELFSVPDKSAAQLTEIEKSSTRAVLVAMGVHVAVASLCVTVLCTAAAAAYTPDMWWLWTPVAAFAGMCSCSTWRQRAGWLPSLVRYVMPAGRRVHSITVAACNTLVAANGKTAARATIDALRWMAQHSARNIVAYLPHIVALNAVLFGCFRVLQWEVAVHAFNSVLSVCVGKLLQDAGGSATMVVVALALRITSAAVTGTLAFEALRLCRFRIALVMEAVHLARDQRTGRVPMTRSECPALTAKWVAEDKARRLQQMEQHMGRHPSMAQAPTSAARVHIAAGAAAPVADTGPVELAVPAETAAPVEATASVEVAAPVEATASMEVAAPVEATASMEVAAPTNAAALAEPIARDEAAASVEAAAPVDRAAPVETEVPVAAAVLVEPATPVESLSSIVSSVLHDSAQGVNPNEPEHGPEDSSASTPGLPPT